MSCIKIVLTPLLLFCMSFGYAQNVNAPYKNKALAIELRVDDLLKRMTLEEKVAQTLCMTSENANFFMDRTGFNEVKAALSISDGLGAVYDIPREHINRVQKYLLEKTRLGIPVLLEGEALHGLAMKGHTSYPQAIAMAGTFDPELLRQSMEYTAAESRNAGILQLLCPVVDVARDLRWGRIEETYGEDPWLNASFGIAAVKGLQGSGKTIDSLHVAATLKHFAGYGNSEGGINCAPNHVSEREFREIYLYPFEQTIKVANVSGVMASYNERDGLPTHANEWLLRTVLRNDWNYKGLVVSDWFGVERLYTQHHTAADSVEAAAQGMNSGVDLELPNRKCYPALTQLVKEGKVNEKHLDDAVKRILTLKFKLGLFDNPYLKMDDLKTITHSEKVKAHALLCAQKAIVLLSNKNNAAPLQASKLKTIAVIGPNAADTVLGGYSGVPHYYVSVLQGIQTKVGKNAKVVYHRGCTIPQRNKLITDKEAELKIIQEAVAVARQADVVVLAIGGNQNTDFEGWVTELFGDRTNLDLAGLQAMLVTELAKLDKPIYTFLIGGKPFIEPVVYEKSDAVFQCWYLGQETGTAIADVLFGTYNPGAKLTVSVPRSMGHAPSFYNHKPSAQLGYQVDDVSPLFPFGYGLSYTQFSFSDLKLSQSKIKATDSVVVSITLKNTGNCAGEEVVQLYIRDNISSVTRPVKELRGFERIQLASGEQKDVQFTISAHHLEFFNKDMKRVVEPGTFTVMVGNSSADSNLKKITLEVVK